MQIPENLIALGGLITAILSIILAYRSQIKPFQEALYNQQIKSAVDCTDTLVSTQVAIDLFHSSLNESVLDEESFSRFHDSVHAVKQNLRISILRNSPYLPSKVFINISEYLAFLELVLGEMETHEAFVSIGRDIQRRDPWDHFYYKFAIAIASIRDFLGVAPLTTSIARTVGKSKKQKDNEIIENKNKTREIIRLLQRKYDVPTSPMIDIEK